MMRPEKPALSNSRRNSRRQCSFDINLDVASLAGDYIREFGRSHGVETVDALIAATAQLNELPLATLNLKRFPMIKGLKRPYAV